jgi:hypothetical protein
MLNPDLPELSLAARMAPGISLSLQAFSTMSSKFDISLILVDRTSGVASILQYLEQRERKHPPERRQKVDEVVNGDNPSREEVHDIEVMFTPETSVKSQSHLSRVNSVDQGRASLVVPESRKPSSCMLALRNPTNGFHPIVRSFREVSLLLPFWDELAKS